MSLPVVIPQASLGELQPIELQLVQPFRAFVVSLRGTIPPLQLALYAWTGVKVEGSTLISRTSVALPDRSGWLSVWTDLIKRSPVVIRVGVPLTPTGNTREKFFLLLFDVNFQSHHHISLREGIPDHWCWGFRLLWYSWWFFCDLDQFQSSDPNQGGCWRDDVMQEAIPSLMMWPNHSKIVSIRDLDEDQDWFYFEKNRKKESVERIHPISLSRNLSNGEYLGESVLVA